MCVLSECFSCVKLSDGGCCSVYRSLKRGSARVRWQDSPRDVDDTRRRTLPRQFGRSAGTTTVHGGRLRHSETLPGPTGARLPRDLGLDMLDADWPEPHGLDDDIRQVSLFTTRPASSRRRSCYRGQQNDSPIASLGGSLHL